MPNSFKQDKYKLLVEAANDIIYEVDAEGRFTYLNPKVKEVAGYSEEEILGKSFLSFVREDWRERTIAFYQEQIRDSIQSTYYEFPCVTKNGKEVWLGQNVQLIQNEVVIEGFVSIARNITERYKSQILLRQSEERYRGIIENLQFGLMEVGLDDTILYANRPMSQLTGYSDEELVGKVASDLLVDKETKKVIEEQHEKRHEGAASVYEIQIKHKTGNIRWALISGAPIYDADGSIKGSVGIHMDITGKKRSEEILKSTKDLFEKQNIELQKKQKYLNAINSFVTKLLDDDTIDAIAWEIAENVIDEFGFEDCVIYILNKEDQVLEQLAAYGPKMDKDRNIVDPIHISLGKGIVGTVAKTGKAEIVPDTRADSRYILDDQMRLSEMAVPIIADNQVIGVIDSEHPRKAYFTNENLETITTFAFVTIFVAILGLFGLVLYEVQQRIKEIGIRKVLGASVSSIIGLLSTNFLKLILISIVLATPIAYFGMSEWLSGYAYRIDLGLLIFAIPAISILLLALITIIAQSIKAASENPIKSLRYE